MYEFKITYDKQYLSELYGQLLRYKKTVPKKATIGLLLIAVGVSLMHFLPCWYFTSIVLIIIGGIELFSPIVSKPFYIRFMRKAFLGNNEFNITISEEGIFAFNENSESKLMWHYIQDKIVSVPKGALIVLPNRTILYFSKELAGEEAIEYVLSKAKKRSKQK
jgi:hypothetical protein